MGPEETLQTFLDLRAGVLYLVHNSTFNLAFHAWQDPMERVAALAEAYRQTLATPIIGEVLTVGAPPFNVQWWKGLK
jgi:hypothetical protein